MSSLAQAVQTLLSVKLKKETRKNVEKMADELDCSFEASLLSAVEKNDIEALRVLLEPKANLNVKYDSTLDRPTKATPLFIASLLGHYDIASMLLEHRADPNLSADDERTPLMVACRNGHLQVVELLVLWGANTEKCDQDGDTALRYAIEHNHSKVVKYLLEERDEPNGAGADPNVIGSDGWSCLLIACCDNYLEIVVLLLEHHANPYHPAIGGKTCLMMASQNGHIEVLSKLLNFKKGFSKELINYQTDDGWSALALAYDQPKAVKLLLNHGADPNLATKDGWTPLMLACQKPGHPETVDLLLYHKADPNHKNQHGLSAYAIAHSNNNSSIMEILEEAGAQPEYLLEGKLTIISRPKAGRGQSSMLVTKLTTVCQRGRKRGKRVL